MKKIFPRFTHALQTTPFLGRTLVVLSFFFLIIKQIFLVVAYKQVFTEATTGATLLHYLGYAVSDGIVYVILLGYMLINILIKNKIIKTINIVIIACIFLLFVIDVFTMGFMQSRLSILDLNQFI